MAAPLLRSWWQLRGPLSAPPCLSGPTLGPSPPDIAWRAFPRTGGSNSPVASVGEPCPRVPPDGALSRRCPFGREARKCLSLAVLPCEATPLTAHPRDQDSGLPGLASGSGHRREVPLAARSGPSGATSVQARRLVQGVRLAVGVVVVRAVQTSLSQVLEASYLAASSSSFPQRGSS